MTDAANGKRTPANAEPRLLRVTVNGEAFYAWKWSDELTENRREVNYVVRESAGEEVFCLLVDCPLRITGTPELVSVQTTGRTLARAGSVWDRAVTIWESGATDDEGLIRLCSPDIFAGRGQHLRQVFNRLVREYRQGTRECYTPTLTPPATPGLAAPDVDRIEQRLDVLTTAVQQAAMPKGDAPAPVSASTLRQELAPVVEAVKAFGQKMTRELDDVAPHIAADRRRAQLAWIQKVEVCSDVERKAALLATEGLSRPEIAKRLPHKQGKPMTREGVRQALLRFEQKTGQRGLFSRGTYRQNARIEAEEQEADEDGET